MNNTKHVVTAVVFCAFTMSTSTAMATRSDEGVTDPNVTIAVATPADKGAPPELEKGLPLLTQTKHDLSGEGDQILISDTLRIDNWCNHPLRVAIDAQYAGYWYMHAWYYFYAYEGPAVIDALSDNQFVYFYAETTDGSGLVWGGDKWLYIAGYGFAGFGVWDTGTEFGVHTLELHC